MEGGKFIWKHQGSAVKRAEKELRLSGHKETYRQKQSAHIKLSKAQSEGYMGSKAYTEYLQIQEDIMNLPKIDINDGQQVHDRIEKYFAIMKKYGNKPTLAGLGLALGLNRDRMKRMAANESGKIPADVSDELKKVYMIYESLWETYMLEGDVPSLNGIFIGKNQFGYKDVVEQTVVADVRPHISAESIQAKYIGADNELPEDHTKQGDDDAE